MRTHISPKPIARVESTDQESQPGFKPNGFWYAFGNSWSDWVKASGSDAILLPKKSYIYQVDVTDVGIRAIKTISELQAFTREFGVAQHGRTLIDWHRVAESYDGIEIPTVFPYMSWSRATRNNVSWYYGWDVASGCVWDANVIQKLTRMKK